MPLTKEDIRRICEAGYNKKEFIRKLGGLHVLKNKAGHCVFFQPQTKTCGIYPLRPDGCRYYPILYVVDEQECIVDNECPEYSNWNISDIKKRCKVVTQLAQKLLKEAEE